MPENRRFSEKKLDRKNGWDILRRQKNCKEGSLMNKGELIAALAAKTEMTKKESEAALNGVLDVIAESLAKGDKVQLIGFGTFEAKSRPARVARNPRTGAAVKIAACKAPAFKAGKALKDAVNK